MPKSSCGIIDGMALVRKVNILVWPSSILLNRSLKLRCHAVTIKPEQTLYLLYIFSWKKPLCEKFPCSEFFWSTFSCIHAEYGEIRSTNFVFTTNVGKHESEKLWIRTLFTQGIEDAQIRLLKLLLKKKAGRHVVLTMTELILLNF